MTTKKQSALAVAHSAFKHECRILMKTCKAIGTSRALAVYLMVKHGEWDQYLRLSRPDFDSPSFADDYLVTSMMSKHPGLPTTSFDKQHSAVKKWFEAEAACRATNTLLASWSRTGMPEIVVRVQEEILAILGPLTRADLDFCVGSARFGPGATSAISGRNVLPSRKFTSSWDVSPSLLPFYASFKPFKEGFCVPSGRVLDANKVTFVPKTAKVDRAIAIEPHANIFMQLGIGNLIRQRLKRTGYDLSHQKMRNRDRVIQDRTCATIDLASASDTVAYRLVLELLPIEWFHLLDIARSEKSVLDGKPYVLQKFSSMGNGYTFELETLIFIAICRAVGDYGADVFGDDIIVERRYASDVVATLELLGFSVNADKTFLAGRFFESCGVDVHDGVNVRPFFLKGNYETLEHIGIRTANAIRIYAHRRNCSYGCDRRFLSAWLDCVKYTDRGSKTYACYPHDNGIWRDFDECTPSLDKRGWEAYIARVFSGLPSISRMTDVGGALMGALAFGTDTSRPAPLGSGRLDPCSRLHEAERVGVVGHRIRVISLNGQWRDLGAWI